MPAAAERAGLPGGGGVHGGLALPDAGGLGAGFALPQGVWAPHGGHRPLFKPKGHALPGVSQRQRGTDAAAAVHCPAAAAGGAAARHHRFGHAAARRPGAGHPPWGQCGDAQPLPRGRPGKVHPVRQQAPLRGRGGGEPGPFAGEPEQDRI